MSQPILSLKNVAIYQEGKTILSSVNLDVHRGEFIYIIGKTGSGKSSLMKTLYADLALTEGEGHVVDFDLATLKEDDIPFLRRKIGIVFQDFKLLPDRSVKDNMLFVLKATGWIDNNEMERKIEEVLDKVGMKEFANKIPHQLSGGEQQRVGIARAFAIEPKMLLLDEPFGALDALTRGTIQDELMGIVRDTRQTVFMITHDVDEAILLADRILLMSNGNESGGSYVPGGLAEVVVNPLPRERTRAQLHHLPGYYDMRNHIVDFLVSRAKAH